jgi:hypothetical protein
MSRIFEVVSSGVSIDGAMFVKAFKQPIENYLGILT